jgi:hypothetical protein
MRDFVPVRKLFYGTSFSLRVRFPFPLGKGLGVRLSASNEQLTEHSHDPRKLSVRRYPL